MTHHEDDQPNPDEGWPCYFAPEVHALLSAPAVDADLFGAVAALSVAINATRGQVPGSTGSERWPHQRRVPLGSGGRLGIAEYVIVPDADEPHCVITRVQPC